MNARSAETMHVIIIGSAGGQDTLDSLRQDLPETGIVPLSCPDPGSLVHVLRPLSAGTRVLLLRAGDRVEPGYLAQNNEKAVDKWLLVSNHRGGMQYYAENHL